MPVVEVTDAEGVGAASLLLRLPENACCRRDVDVTVGPVDDVCVDGSLSLVD